MGYDYGFEYALPEGVEGVAEGIATGVAGISLGIFALVYLVMLAFGIVCYVLNSVGMYRIAKRRGIHHAWLAWIPVGSNWLLGSISDHYQYVVKQSVTKRRRVMLVLSVFSLVFSGVVAAGGAAVALSASETGATIAAIALMVIGYLGMIGIGIALTVFYYIACFDLFRSCKPSYDVLFLVLGIFFSVTMPFFVFACSGYDQGMPARRPRPAAQIPGGQPQAEQEIPVVQTEVVDETFDL